MTEEQKAELNKRLSALEKDGYVGERWQVVRDRLVSELWRSDFGEPESNHNK